MKYGDNEDIQNIAKQYENNFSSAVDKNAPQDIKDYNKLIQDYNPSEGEKNAKVTILAFIDFECPYCQQNYETFKYIKEKYKPVLRVVFKHLPLTDLHPNAVSSALASTCAQEQDKFWEYYTALFENKKFDNESLYLYAQNIGLNTTKFDVCFKSEKYLINIEKDIADAVNIGLRGTPSYVLNGQILEGSIEQTDWDKYIIQHLNK